MAEKFLEYSKCKNRSPMAVRSVANLHPTANRSSMHSSGSGLFRSSRSRSLLASPSSSIHTIVSLSVFSSLKTCLRNFSGISQSSYACTTNLRVTSAKKLRRWPHLSFPIHDNITRERVTCGLVAKLMQSILSSSSGAQEGLLSTSAVAPH